MRRVGRHPVLRYAEAVVGFLGVEDEEVRKEKPLPPSRFRFPFLKFLQLH